MRLVPGGPPTLTLSPGVLRAPPWLDARGVLRLAELMAALTATPAEIVRLPPRALGVRPLPPLQPGRCAILVVAQVDLNPAQEEALGALGAGWVVLAPSGPGTRAGYGWVERTVKAPLLARLRRWLAQPERLLLGEYGLAALDLDLLAAWFPDPLDLLDVLETTLEHRLGYAPEGLGPIEWAGSLRVATGRAVGARMSVLADDLPAAVATALGLDDVGGRALARIGLASADGQPGAWTEAIAHLDGLGSWESALPERAWEARSREVVRARRREERPPLGPGSLVMRSESGVGSNIRLTQALIEVGTELPTQLQEALVLAQDVEDRPWRDPDVLRGEVALVHELTRPWVEDVYVGRSARLIRAASQLLMPDPGIPSDQALAALDVAAGKSGVEIRTLARIKVADDGLFRGDITSEALDRIHQEIETMLPACPAGAVRLIRLDVAFQRAVQLQREGKLDTSEEILRSVVVPGYCEVESPKSLAYAFRLLAHMMLLRREADDAIRLLRAEVLPIYKRLDVERERALTLGGIADALTLRGDLREALRIRREEELPVYSRLGDERSQLMTEADIVYLRVLSQEAGIDDGIRICELEILPRLDRVGSSLERARLWSMLSSFYLMVGQPDEALRIAQEEVAPIYRRVGLVAHETIAWCLVASALAARGDDDAAIVALRDQHLPKLRELGLRAELVAFSFILAMTLLHRDRPGDRAEAERMQREMGDEFDRVLRPVSSLIGAVLEIPAGATTNSPAIVRDNDG